MAKLVGWERLSQRVGLLRQSDGRLSWVAKFRGMGAKLQ